LQKAGFLFANNVYTLIVLSTDFQKLIKIGCIDIFKRFICGVFCNFRKGFNQQDQSCPCCACGLVGFRRFGSSPLFHIITRIMKQINYNKVRRTAFFASVMAMLAISQRAEAQNWVNGGNALLGAGTIGTTTPQNVSVITNGVARITTLGVAGPTQGFVGIGLVNPATRLEVLSDVRVRSTIVGSQLTMSANSRQIIDGSTELRISSANSLFNTFGTSGASPVSYNISYGAPGNILTTVLDNGFMGIGTISPTAKLQVRGGQISQLQGGAFGNFANGNEWIGLGLAGSAAFPIPNVYGMAVARGGYAGYFNLVSTTSVPQIDLIIGFGNEGAAADPNQRLRIRNIVTNGAAAPLTKDLMIFNPRGYVGVGSDPGAVAFAVDATPGVLPAAPGLVRGISVLTNGSFAAPASASFASIGELVSSICPTNSVVGMRGQNGQAGVNCQVNNSNAEIIWQDLTFGAPVNTTSGFESRITFNFRNNVPGPCNPANNRETMTILPNGRVGINTAPGLPVFFGVTNVPPVAGIGIDFYLDVIGGVRAEGFWAFSDQKFKSNITTIENPMDRIMKMRGTRYVFNAPSKTEGQQGYTQLGFIAQELEQVVPEAVVQGNDGIYAVNYNAITPLLVEGIKEQQNTIVALTNRVAELEKQLASQQGNATPAGGFQDQLPVNPALGNLQQNVPNPFNQQTVINYTVAQNATVAMLTIYDLNGRQIRSEQLNQRGAGQFVINANELAPGMYIYALIVDGKAADSKRMIVTE
jgi:hypothetical protein